MLLRVPACFALELEYKIEPEGVQTFAQERICWRGGGYRGCAPLPDPNHRRTDDI